MKSITIIIILFCSIKMFGGGFQINEHNSRVMGMGGAFVALANDPSAVFFNGAGILQQYGTNFLVGTTMITPRSSFNGVYPEVTGYEVAKQYFFPVHFFATHRINEDWAVGLGFTSPFGLGTKWDDNWAGKYLALETTVKIFTITPVVAYKLLNNLNISAGLEYSFSDVTITRKNSQTPFTGDAFVTLKGSDKAAFGFNAGILYMPSTEFSIGAAYHHSISYKYKGTAVTTTDHPQLEDLLPNGNITSELTVPNVFTIGASYKGVKNLTLDADFEYVGWSSYDTLKVNFDDPKYTDIASPRVYDNSFVIRLGGEYSFESGLVLQAGAYYDRNPVKSKYLNPSLPESDRIGLSAGIGYKFNDHIKINASYLYIGGKHVTVDNSEESYTTGNAPFNGTYNSSAYLGAISLSYSL